MVFAVEVSQPQASPDRGKLDARIQTLMLGVQPGVVRVALISLAYLPHTLRWGERNDSSAPWRLEALEPNGTMRDAGVDGLEGRQSISRKPSSPGAMNRIAVNRSAAMRVASMAGAGPGLRPVAILGRTRSALLMARLR
ncbi:MAG: hypothetical protein AMXMBFR33_15130 [Candidatus Xenobia bacterium]